MPTSEQPSTEHIHPCDSNYGLQIRGVRDASGWRVQVHIHDGESCGLLEGNARYTTKEAMLEHASLLRGALNLVLGIDPIDQSTDGN